MKFNLKHFLGKRNLTVVEWAHSHGINSIEEYDQFMLNGEFHADSTLREELKLGFFKNFIKKAEEILTSSKEEELEIKKTEEINASIETELSVTESDKTLIETEEKPSKKKRSKVDPSSV